ncbi:hypothetical protein [Natronospira bacteriovora]|uniref:Phage terminase large subunit-like protein n=1 Tax=Natronospira bacteriovora TaxID=3069753 RepID=A0ABU0W4Z2_9GAMM|nr:hypothetical protein [Natronospira sp. AB-CW4]MDQ2069061.1 hypothetical protein [Natronospira sp. AB-CW4]
MPAAQQTTVTIRDAMTDPALFGNQFAGDTWSAWRALFAGFDGLTLDSTERKHWEALTGRTSAPTQRGDELYLVVGRRGGKTNTAALRAVYDAAFTDYTDRLAPGEVATVMVLAADRKQARSCFRYISGLLHDNPMLERMIVREDKESIELSNRTAIEVHTASFRAVRGYTVACCIADEVAFWRSEDSANPDFEIINAIRPAMATLDGRLIVLSSPYAKRGVLWDAYRRYYGKAGPIVVAKAPSRTMNPALPQRVIDQAMERDPESAKAEYLAEFRSDLEQFVQREVVEACVMPGRYELPYLSEHRYRAFVDPSGGSRDSMTLAIGHDEGQTVVVDAIREVKPPFSPEAVVSDFADLMRDYRISRVEGDRYGGEWPRERFAMHRITYDVAQKPRSDLYRDMLPLLNSKRIELPDNDRLVIQLCSLERRTGRSGKDTIDHGTGAHDDLCNAVAGLVAGTKRPRKRAGVW